MSSVKADEVQIVMASERRPGKPRNEDSVGAVDTIAFVLDGASVPKGVESCCSRTASWYVQHLAARLVAALSRETAEPLPHVLARAIGEVAAEHAATCPRIAEHDALGPSSTVAILRQQDHQLEYLVLGDSMVLVETAEKVDWHCDQRLLKISPEVDMQLYQCLAEGRGYGDPEFRRLLVEQTNRERALRNRIDGYWTAGHEPAAAFESLTGSYQLGDRPGQARRAALLSDGLGRAVMLFGLYDSWEPFLQALAIEGPAACIAKVRAAEAADPDGSQYPREYVSDDASGLVATFIPV
ncbi:MAG TPA: hypothetical protein VF486_23755 [Actinomycetes bacterium]